MSFSTRPTPSPAFADQPKESVLAPSETRDDVLQESRTDRDLLRSSLSGNENPEGWREYIHEWCSDMPQVMTLMDEVDYLKSRPELIKSHAPRIVRLETTIDNLAGVAQRIEQEFSHHFPDPDQRMQLRQLLSQNIMHWHANVEGGDDAIWTFWEIINANLDLLKDPHLWPSDNPEGFQHLYSLVDKFRDQGWSIPLLNMHPEETPTESPDSPEPIVSLSPNRIADLEDALDSLPSHFDPSTLSTLEALHQLEDQWPIGEYIASIVEKFFWTALGIQGVDRSDARQLIEVNKEHGRSVSGLNDLLRTKSLPSITRLSQTQEAITTEQLKPFLTRAYELDLPITQDSFWEDILWPTEPTLPKPPLSHSEEFYARTTRGLRALVASNRVGTLDTPDLTSLLNTIADEREGATLRDQINAVVIPSDSS